MAEPDSVRLQIEEIKTITDRSHAYTTFLHLLRQSANDASAMESLSLFSPPLLTSLLHDSHNPSEEIAVLALKCLGFNLYHPSLVATLSEEAAQSVLGSLVNLILATQIKAVCNLGVWCLSVQQLNASVLESRVQSLVHVIVYALDNPFGSLSTTLEATQAVVKLATQIPSCTKDMSDMWAPPIYKRLLSTDKTECDMAERCLLKLCSVVASPHIALSKVMASDLNQSLIGCMRDMVRDNQKKVQAIKAWGWFMYLLSLDASQNTLVNEMLKIPESTFADNDQQVQIATLVSWRHLINALQPQITKLTNNRNSEIMLQSLLKKIKLVLVPLKGIMSKKCNLAVQSCCLRTWLHLIHKLVPLLIRPLVLEIAFGSFLEVIFSIGPDMPLWASCIDIFYGFVLSKIEQKESNVDGCIINWVPWDVSLLDFHLKMIGLIFTVQNLKSKEAGLKIFQTLMQGIRIELKRSCSCLKSIFKFFREVCEAKQCDDPSRLCLEFVRCLKVDPNDSSDISFLKDLCEYLLGDIDDTNGYFTKNLSDLGEITTVIMENAMVFERSSRLFGMKNILELVSRFLKLSVVAMKANSPLKLGTTNRVITSLAEFIGKFPSMQDIDLLFEVMSDTLTELMSLHSILDDEVHHPFKHQLQHFWSCILDCLNRSKPPTFTNSSFLKTNSSLFRKALKHPHSPISKATAEFLKSKSRLDKFPQDDAFKKFEMFSEMFGLSVMNGNVFPNVSMALNKKKLKITKYGANAIGPDACKIVGPCSRIRVLSDNEKEMREIRRPEQILEMLKRKR